MADDVKRQLRRQLRAGVHSSEECDERSAAIVRQLRAHQQVRSARVVMAFCALPDEPALLPLLDELVEQGSTVLLPRVVDAELMEIRRYTGRHDLRVGAFHILEPMGPLFTDVDKIDVVLVPGMAFDAAGHRLGRGRGYYDRFLAACPKARKIGVCFRFRLLDSVPVDVHDILMDEVVSG